MRGGILLTALLLIVVCAGVVTAGFGDLNGDGVVNVQDLLIIVQHIHAGTIGNADVNGDGVVNIFDLVQVANVFGKTYSVPDTTPPVISGGTPTQTLVSGTTNTSLSVTTNENATCRYSTTPGTAYSSMPSTFSTTGGTTHSTTVTGLTNGTSYTYYVRCASASGNSDTQDLAIRFAVSPSNNMANECANWRTNHPDWVFCDDFESGNLSLWGYAVPKANVQSQVVFAGKYALNIPYDGTCASVPNWQTLHPGYPCQLPNSVDNNRFVQLNKQYLYPLNLTHFFIRGYVYFANTTGSQQSSGKKLFYLWGNSTDPVHWDIMVSATTETGNSYPADIGPGLQLHFDTNNHNWSDLTFGGEVRNAFQYNAWNELEIEVKENTNPACTPKRYGGTDCDGAARAWVDGKLVFNRTGIKLRDSADPLNIIRVGAQADSGGNVSEERYWDNIVVSRDYIP